MLTRDEILSVIRLALNDLYLRFNYEITQKKHPVLTIDQDLTDQIEPHLRQQLLRKPSNWPSGTVAEPKRYQDPNDALKVVDFGTTKGRRQLSITLHTPDSHDFNVLALLVKCEWKTDPLDLYRNYSTAIAVVGDFHRYAFGICAELSQVKAESKAYLTSREIMNNMGRDRYRELSNDLIDLRIVRRTGS